MFRRIAIALAFIGLTGCSGTSQPVGGGSPAVEPVTITIVGTNDLHGHIEALPMLAGYVNLLRQQRDDRVLLVDAGDMFQGTLESNLGEGAAVIDAYNAMGYAAACVGNHEFDFGPVGDAPTPQSPSDDPRGALKARARQAKFPILTANVLDADTDKQVRWRNMPPTTMRSFGDIDVGIIGVTTEQTPYTTISANFAGLEMAPLAAAISVEARALRADGAEIVVVLAHAGSACKSFVDPDNTSSCRENEEVFEVAKALPAGAVDVIVAGHTHAGVAHRVNGIAIIEQYYRGIAFGRVDVTAVPGGDVTAVRIFPPRTVCGDAKPPCERAEYDGKPVVADAEIAALIKKPFADARAVRERKLGVVVEAAVPRAYGRESALGNLFADLMREARPGADVAITNGGGLRASLPEGPLEYGSLYEAMPFDNRFALVRMNGAQLRALITANLRGDHGVFSVSGIRVTARCGGKQLTVNLTRPDGTAVKDDAPIVLATSDFLASGGDGMTDRLGLAQNAISTEDAVTIRDEMARVLTARGGTLRGDDKALFDPAARRLRYPGSRPVTCE